jgi:CheY-like chemotaxis protein
VEAGKLTLEYSTFNPKTAIKEVVQIFSQKIEEKALNVLIDIDKSVPDGIILDETRFRQILLNLLSNAVKFTDKGTIKISTRAENISSSRCNFYVSVEDTGIGIPPRQMSKIFGAFEQQDGQSHAKFGGTGLGLTITQRLTRMMNGEITPISSLGEGSVFNVKLRDVEIAKPDEQDANTTSFDPEKTKFLPAEVLVMSEDIENRAIFKGYLNIYPELNCRDAKNPEEAFKMIMQKRPDIILADVKMKKPGDCEFLRILKSEKAWKDIPTIASTASVRKESEEELRRLCRGFLRKPITRRELVLELMKHIKHSQIQYTETSTKETEFSIKEVKAPEELLIFLEKELKENFQQLQDEMMMNKIEEFGQSLKEAAEKHNAAFLENYALELIKMVNSFDIVKLPEIMKKFPETVNKMKTSMEKN